MPSDRYVLTLSPTSGGDPDLGAMRGRAIADAYARFRRTQGDDVLLDPAVDDALVERWGQWLLERLAAADLIYRRDGEGWRLRSGNLHAESERRLDELQGWSDAAVAGQRRLLEHVDDPGDTGNELEQSLSKLAAAGWSVDSKKDKGPPTVHYAAGDMPLATGDDWRAPGTLHPRFAAALAALIGAAPPGPDVDPAAHGAELAGALPALAVVSSGADAALLDLRTVAKALRDAGALDLPDGEPAGPVLASGPFKLRAAKRKATASANGATPVADANDPAAQIAARGADAVRFALLHAAAPEKRFAGEDDVVGYAASFLAGLREFASTHLDGTTAAAEIDSSDALRRRLAGWCDTAVAKTAENYERLDLHRATRNAIALFARIEDFEARVARERSEVTGRDREAVAVAVAVLAKLLTPLAPAAADDLAPRGERVAAAAHHG
ncbi:MAG TPA: hypothetical protein VFQ14_00700 [Thermoleophilaceae bacterium]|nr:hypothetical protein [Thermoleophilaceae bacterium]